jgi:mono/diheme cytochrome c family protein
MSNAQSCADCHHQAGTGGAGGNEHNVDLLCLIPPSRKKTLDSGQRQSFIAGVRQIHPALAVNLRVLPAITLHKFAENPAYERWRAAVMLSVDYLPPGESPERIGLQIARRCTPALFGAGQIDSIPESVIEQEARRQAMRPGGVKGQVARATDGRVGRFGWRGQTSSLKQFVMGACANELGLKVPGNEQPLDPLDPEYKSAGLDLEQPQCDELVAFVASLAPPLERRPENREENERWHAGQRIFNRVGCADCHVPKLGEVAGIYSDLLLHDLGRELADPAGANPPGTLISPGSTPQYYGGPTDVFADIPPKTLRQWRTPPLWGVGDSAPYLHDGRAATLDDAILAHGGEAASARIRFEGLAAEHRHQLLAYLETLGQPAP